MAKVRKDRGNALRKVNWGKYEKGVRWRTLEVSKRKEKTQRSRLLL